jgi:hypothetical protein
MFGLATVLTAVAAMQAGMSGGPAKVVAVGFGVGAAVLWYVTMRAFFVGVFARANGVVIRGMWRTTKIPWGEIEIVAGPSRSRGLVDPNAITPHVVRRKPGRPSQRVAMPMLGSYGIVRRDGQTLSERAVVGLNDYRAALEDENDPQRAKP